MAPLYDPIMLADGEVVILGEPEDLPDGGSGGGNGDPVIRIYENATGGSIPDRGTLTSVISVGADVLIADLDVTLTIMHNRVSDLIIELIAPDGTVIRLTSNLGGRGDDYLGTVFDDDAATNAGADSNIKHSLGAASGSQMEFAQPGQIGVIAEIYFAAQGFL